MLSNKNIISVFSLFRIAFLSNYEVMNVSDRYKTQEPVIKIIFQRYFMLKYCLIRYETQEMRDKAFNAFLPALNFVPD